MVVHLFDLSTPTFANTATSSITIGDSFTTIAQGAVTQLGWYRRATSGITPPRALSLWNQYGTKLATVTSPPDNGAVGWQFATLSPPIDMQPNAVYYVTGQWLSGDTRWQNTTNVHQATPSPIGWTTPLSHYVQSLSYDGFPTTADDLANHPFDVTFDPGNQAGLGFPPYSTPESTSNELAAWLSTADGTHTDSAPLQDHTTLATVNTNVGDVKDQQNEWAFGLGALAHGYFGLVKVLIDDIKAETDHLPAFIASVTTVMLDHYTSDIDNILAQIDSVLAGLSAQSAEISGTGGSAFGSLSARSPFPSSGWSMSAETDFTDNVLFDEPADAYVLSITSYQPTQPADSTAAGLWLPRLGWWCVVNGSLASQRQFVDFQQMMLSDQGRRMPACAIELKPGTLGHVQAWVLA